MVDETDKKLLQEADFPDNVDRGQCESAILEVYRYIKANGQSSRDDIWSNVVLDTGKESAGRELCRTKGYVPKFKDWWWEKIVVPGLEALPEIEQSNTDSNQWEFCGKDQYALSDWSDAETASDDAGDTKPAYPVGRLQTECAICGGPLDYDQEFSSNYVNLVCETCDSRAVTAEGEEPKYGFEYLGEYPTEDGKREPDTIYMDPDVGDNPVYIDGHKCWRRYRFGGWITRRDDFECDSIEEFYQTHRND